MFDDKEKSDTIIERIFSIVIGVTGVVVSYTTGIPLPLGAFVSSVLLFYDIYKRDPFKLSERELRNYIRKAIELEAGYRKELEDLERVKKRVEKGEIAVSDITSLDIRIKQVKELIKLARVKKNIAETILIVRENIEVFKKLFGEKNFDKLVSDIENLHKKIDEVIRREGIKEIDMEEITTYLRNIMPLIIKEPEKYVERAEIREKEISTKPEEKPVDVLEELLVSGTVDQWIEFIRKAVSENTKIKLPRGKYHEKKGYKNLLKSLYIVEYDVNTLRRTIEDKLMTRFIEYIKILRNGKTIEVDVQSSDLNYLNDLLEKISDSVEEKVDNGQKIYIYKFSINSEQVAIEKKIVKDQVSGRATKAIFRRTT